MSGILLSLQSAVGLLGLAAIAWLISENRRAIPWRTVGAGISLQLLLAILLFRLPGFRRLFLVLDRLMESLTRALDAGTSFVFGYLGGGPLPFEPSSPAETYVFAFRVLPFILLISALSALLFYWRILPLVVKAMSVVLRKTMRVGGAVGLGVAANVFMGMIEAPLLIAPYLKRMSRAELFVIMSSGMATVSGTVMVLYARILSGVIPDALGHVLAASLINAPASVVAAVLMVPPGRETTAGELVPPAPAHSAMDALTQGAEQGMRLVLNIAAMLVVLVALVSLLNQVFGLLPPLGGEPVTMQRVAGYLFAPIAWLMGIPWRETVAAGGLLGTKTVLNELIAYVDLSHLPAGALSLRSRMIMSYALCGFANFWSLGIMIGGLGTMVPGRRSEIAGLGLRSIAAGTLATCMSGAVVGIVGG